MAGSSRVAAGIFASRVFGLVREIVIAVALGISPTADAFRVAMRVPNLLQNLLGEGTISAAFVPVYANLIEQRRERDAAQLARQTLGLLTATVTLLVALIVLLARPLVWVTTFFGALQDPTFSIAVSLVRYTALGVGVLVLSAWCLGILNTHRRYLLSYSAPVLWSLFQIAALGLAIVMLGGADSGADLESVARWGAIGMVLGSVAQFAVQVPSVMKLSGVRAPSWGIGPDVLEVLRRFVPAVGGRGVVQLSSFVDLALASLLVVGAISTIALVMPLYLLSISVFGFSVAVSELTEMSRTQGGYPAVAARVRAANRRVLLPAGLVTAGAVGAGSTVIGSLYEELAGLFGRGEALFSSENTMAAAATLAAFGLGLPAAMSARVTQNALYAIGDVKGPARIAVARLVVGALIGFVLMLQFDRLAIRPEVPIDGAVATQLGLEVSDGPVDSLIRVGPTPHLDMWKPLPASARKESDFVHLGPVGLGLGAAAASWFEWFLLRRRLGRELNHPIGTGIGQWIAIAGAAAFVAARVVAELPLPPFIDLAIVGIVMAGVYMGSLHFIGVRARPRAA